MKRTFFTTTEYEQSEREAAWRKAMRPHSYAVSLPFEEVLLRGQLLSVLRPSGLSFTHLEGSRQHLLFSTEFSGPISLFLLLEGRCSYVHSGSVFALEDGDIICAQPHEEFCVILEEDVSALLVNIPPGGLNPIRLSSGLAGFVRLSGRAGVGGILSGLLRSLAGVLDTISVDEIRPVEIVLPDFLWASLFPAGSKGPVGSVAMKRALMLEGLIRAIDLRLDSSALSIEDLSREHGLPARYVREAIAEAGVGFEEYVRGRKLDKAFAELLDPIYKELTIGQVGMRWGFNDPANFSRYFRERFGASPREHRRGLSDR